MDKLISQLVIDYPDFSYKVGTSFRWSPKNREITYIRYSSKITRWAVLHELGHALLNHNSFSNDFELLKLEVSAWQKAIELAPRYNLTISPTHVQNCLDTYREWLHSRSTCPACGLISTQYNPNLYRCFNCRSEWKVSSSRFCRAYRQLDKSRQKSSTKLQTIFS